MKQGLILVVDDNESVRIGLRLLLESEGFTVAEATNGSEALEFLKSHQPEAIICDVEMPVMDGYQFRKAVMQHPLYSVLPFFFLTAHTTIAETVQGLDLEVDDYIPKTISAAVLRKKIENAILKREKQRRAATAELAEASVASGVQLLPEKPPSVPGFAISQFHQPYRQTPGGDFLDYLTFPDTTYVVLGDVMGKQWHAWMFAQAYVAYVRSTIRSLMELATSTVSPATILTQLNTTLCRDEKTREILLTLIVLQLSHLNNTVRYASAAHIPSYLLKSNAEFPRLIDHGSAPLAHAETTRYEDTSFSMDEGDVLVVLTDGITEATREDGTEFGEQALLSLLNEKRHEDNLAQAIINGAIAFSGKKELDDDATILILRRASQ